MAELSLIYKIAFGLIPHVGDISAKKLLSHFGSVEAVFREPYGNLVKTPGIGPTLAQHICNRSYFSVAEKEAEFVTRHGIKTFFYLDGNYPYRLKQCEDSPVVFFYKGNADLNANKLLSVVGTRNATPRGKELCNKIIETLAERHPDLIIVSGLAYGIDIEAHKAALANNLPTVGVLGHGLKTLYPSVHISIAKKMAESGGLLTDFISDGQPERTNFVKRNRIIAGLSDATLVVESGIKGGALITADIANSYNRDVLALPGRPDDKWSAGCNNLIKTNKAALVECAADIEYFLGWESKKNKQPVQKSLFAELDDSEKIIFELISKEGEMTIDAICRSCGIPVHRLSAQLLQMEFKGAIKCMPGNIYKTA